MATIEQIFAVLGEQTVKIRILESELQAAQNELQQARKELEEKGKEKK